MDEDFMLALRLQEQFDNEYETPSYSSSASDDEGFGQSSKKRKVEVSVGDVVPYWKPKVQPDRPLSIVDSSWETLDPSPDVRAMFLEFNDTFFWGKLSGVEVKWSPRMTLCAGVCSYEGRGGLCSIRLSAPLLKLRPRKDLVQTLLHEMIHALLFVTQNNRDRDGHGPEFCKHMNRINDATGTQISVYHSFHGEVDVVPAALVEMQRALIRGGKSTGRTCGGTYSKVKEPEGYGKKGKKGDKKDDKKEDQLPPWCRKPLKKKSVGNTRAFVNINGSPVRISRPRSSNRSQDADKNTQRSIEGLFTSTSLRRNPMAALVNHHSPSISVQLTVTVNQKLPVLLRHRGRGRWNERGNSPSLYDFFQRALGQRFSSAEGMPESDINQHLDSCLS
ncbi:hypothetical protein KUCAC02_022162 [Chaenocephalus aceratus]|nr:hypothetical protein KUCAC02_022162 [Chaenocephalus aceratus]